jgi:hypothetical protein
MIQPISTAKSMMVIAIAEELTNIRKRLDDIYCADTKEFDVAGNYSIEDITNIIITLNSLSNIFDITNNVVFQSKALYETKINHPVISALWELINNTLILIDDSKINLNVLDHRYSTDVFKVFGKVIANVQQRADIVYYADKPPRECENERSGAILNELIPIIRICEKINIKQASYNEAYKIYDFSNSGKKGYALVDGKIIKVE